MYTPLGTAALTGGETLHCGVVQTPDQEWGPRLIPFLQHKQPQWRSHIAASFERELDQLETRFYVGTLNDPHGPLVTTVMVAGSARTKGRVGLLGYVFTAPEHRGKGAYSALMAHQMKHCQDSGFTILTLTTQRDSTAWRIYERFGFRADDRGPRGTRRKQPSARAASAQGVRGTGLQGAATEFRGVNHPTTTGRMHWHAHPDALENWFRPSSVTTHPLTWEDWTALNVTAVQVPNTDEEPPRSWALYLPSHGTAEGTFSDVLPAWAQLIGKRRRERASHAVTFRAQSGAVAGWLFVLPDPLSLGSARHVDFYLHPSFEQLAAGALVRELESLGAGVTAYVTRPDGYRAQALERAGFQHSGTLPGWLSQEGAALDVHAFRKSQ